MSFLVSLDIGLTMGLILGWSVIGFAVAFRLFDFPDLTVEASFPLGAATWAVLVRSGVSTYIALPVSCLSGAVAGALTGFLYARFRINKFLAGVIVVAISYSLTLRIMGSSNVGLLGTPSLLSGVESLDRGQADHFHFATVLSLGALAMLGTALIVRLLVSRRGMQMRAAGSNPAFASSLGIRTGATMVVALACTNAMAAFSGVLLSMHQGFADVGMGQGILIVAIAATTIGERLTPQHRMSFPLFVLISALAGSLVYQVLVAIAVGAGLPPTDLRLVTGIFVLVVVALRITGSRESSLQEAGR